MFYKNGCVLLLISWYVAKLAAEADVRYKKACIDKFAGELKERIDLVEECKKNRAGQDYTVCSFTGKDIGVGNTLRALQSLFNTCKSNAKITVITVRYDECKRAYNTIDHMKSFVTAMRKQIDQDGIYVSSNGLCLSVDYIEHSDIQSFDLINFRAKQTREIHKKLEEWFINNLQEISFYMLKKHFLEQAFENDKTRRIERLNTSKLRKKRNKQKVCRSEPIVTISSRIECDSMVLRGPLIQKDELTQKGNSKRDKIVTKGKKVKENKQDRLNQICKEFRDKLEVKRRLQIRDSTSPQRGDSYTSDEVAQSDETNKERKIQYPRQLNRWDLRVVQSKIPISPFECAIQNFREVEAVPLFESEWRWKVLPIRFFSDYICLKHAIIQMIIGDKKHDNQPEVEHFFHNLAINKHSNALIQNMKDLLSLILAYCEAHKEEIENEYKTHRPLRQKKKCKTNKSKQLFEESELEDHMAVIAEGKFLRFLFEKYLNVTFRDEMECKLKEKHKERNEKLIIENNCEKVCNIVFSGKIDNLIVHKICNIVNDIGLFNQTYDKQIIYVDTGKKYGSDKLTPYITKCETKQFDVLTNPISIKVISKTTSDHVNDESTISKVLVCNLELTDKSVEGFKIEHDNLKPALETNIKLNVAHEPNNDDIDACVSSLICKCTEYDKSAVESYLQIVFNTDYESVGIHIIYHTSFDEKKTERIALIYVIQSKCVIDDNKEMNDTKKYVKCLNNAPTTFLESLNEHLQNQQIRSHKWQIPNLISMETGDLTYSTKIVQNIGNRSPTGFICNYVEKVYNCKYFSKMCCKFKIKDIIEYEIYKKCQFDSTLKNFFTKLGIEEAELNSILHRILVNTTIENNGADFSYRLDKFCHFDRIVLYVTAHDNGDKILNICETVENTQNDRLLIHTYKVFAEIMKNKEYALIIKSIDNALKTQVSKSTFVSMVFDDIFQKASFEHMNFASHGRINIEAEKYTSAILDMFNKISDEKKNECVTVQEIQQSGSLDDVMKKEKIKLLIETIIKGLNELVHRQTMKITSVKISKQQKFDASSETKRRRLITGNESYEDIEHLTCQECQLSNQH